MVADADSTNCTPVTRRHIELRGNPPIYLPFGWEPVDTALSWIAFGTALRRWDWEQYLFTGVDDRLPSHRVMAWLEVLSIAPASLVLFGRGLPGQDFHSVPMALRDSLDAAASTILARRGRQHLDGNGAIRRAAKLLLYQYTRKSRADPEWGFQHWDSSEQGLVEAEHELLRRAADGDVPLFGWPGDDEAQTITAPRLRIPPETCAAPVSFYPDGSLLPCLKTDMRDRRALFKSVVIPGDVLLALWPREVSAAGSAPSQATPRPDVRIPAEGRPTGRPRTHDWTLFNQELVRRVALDGGNLRRGELIAAMNDWAANNMTTQPSESAIGRAVAALAPRGGVIPD